MAAEPTIGANVTPIPVAEVAAVGPASVMVDAPILAGPGPEFGLMATASEGSTVEKTGHVIDGYVTVQYAEVTGWVALDHLGTPSTHVEEPLPAETAAPIEAPPADAAPAEPPPTELAPPGAEPAETSTPENPTMETPTTDTSSADMTPIESAPVDMAPIEAAPVDAPPGEVAPFDAA
jgi:ribonuclease E